MSHQCHATACEHKIPASMWCCRRHWRMVPRAIQNSIWRYYRQGQEDDWKPSRQYLLAAKSAVEAVAEEAGIESDTSLYDAFLRGEGS